MKGFFSTFEEFVKSKNFEKIINLIPKINKAKNMEEVLVVLVSLLYDLSLKLPGPRAYIFKNTTYVV